MVGWPPLDRRHATIFRPAADLPAEPVRTIRRLAHPFRIAARRHQIAQEERPMHHHGARLRRDLLKQGRADIGVTGISRVKIFDAFHGVP